ncbi:MAG: DUF58 domain-containing protein [Alphaproteobacteria bacterium]|nr:DUF58 domain-containing protein [Alphaproteobacteria bacterium]
MLYPRLDELVALKSKIPHLTLSSNRTTPSPTAGDHHSPFRGQGLEFEEVRKYAPGDEIRNIDWRVTARTGMAHTKVFREERERNVIVCVDVNSTMRFGTRGTFKSIQAARIAALLGWWALTNHHKIGSCLFGDVPGGIQFLAPKRSRKSLWTLFKQLSGTHLSENASPILLEDMLDHVNKSAPTGTLIFIISDFNTQNSALEQKLAHLQKRCEVALVTTDDPADQSIPPVGIISFAGDHQEKLSVNTDSRSGREAYTAQWLKTRQSLQQISIKLKIGLIQITTDATAHIDLFQGLKRIRQGRKH